MIRKLLLALAAMALPAVASGEKPGGARIDADPAVWVVKDADTTVYLFGTFHLLDDKRDWFNDEVKTAFDASDEVQLEALLPDDPNELLPLTIEYALSLTKPLSERLSPETMTKLRAAIAPAKIPENGLELFDPWFAGMLLSTLAADKLGLSADLGAETVLTKAAKEAGKPLGELEGAKFQLELLDSFPEELQVAFVEEALTEDEEVAKMLPAMLAAWSAGEAEKLGELLNRDAELSPELHKRMLVDRNAAWAEWIVKRLEQPGSVFIAVGAAHLAGNDSVQKMLESKGLTVARVQ